MEETASPSKVGLKYGLITGLVLVIYLLILHITDLITNQSLGYVGYIFLLGGIIFAYNDFKRQNGGYMTYGQGLGIGSLLSAAAGTLSGVFTFIYVKFIDNSFFDKLREMQITELEKKNMTEEQIDQAMIMIDKFSTPTMLVIVSIIGNLFFGFILSLIISAIMKKTPVELNTLDAG